MAAPALADLSELTMRRASWGAPGLNQRSRQIELVTERVVGRLVVGLLAPAAVDIADLRVEHPLLDVACRSGGHEAGAHRGVGLGGVDPEDEDVVGELVRRVEGGEAPAAEDDDGGYPAIYLLWRWHTEVRHEAVAGPEP